MLDAVLHDARNAWRGLRRRPGFVAVAVLTFGLGIGLHVAVFSVLDRVLIRALPYTDPEQLVVIRTCDPDGQCSMFLPGALAKALPGLSTIDSLAATGPTLPFTVSPDLDSDRLQLLGVSPNLLRVLGVMPVAGRDFTDGDATQSPDIALIGYETWQRRLGGDPDVIGRDLWSAARRVTIVGVLPEEFMPPSWTLPTPEWDGLVLSPALLGSTDSGSGLFMGSIVRLRAGATIAQARAEVATLAQALAPPLAAGGVAPDGLRTDSLRSVLFEGEPRRNFWLILGATSLLLAVACANLAALLLAYGRSREREMAIAAALGATRARLLRSACAEALFICVAGTAVAMLAVGATSGLLRGLLPPLLARYATGVTDPRVLLVSLLLAMLCAGVAALAPSLRVGRVELLGVIQRVPASGRRRGTWSLAGLLGVETTMGVVLVLGSLLFLQTLNNLANDDLGFEPEGLYQVSVVPRLVADADNVGPAYFEQVAEAVQDAPGIAAVGRSNYSMTGPSLFASMFEAEPGINVLFETSFPSEQGVDINWYRASDSFFEVLRTPLIAGRSFLPEEVRQDAQVSVVTAGAARVLWPDVPPADAVGLVLVLGGEGPKRVVGVVPDFKWGPGLSVARPSVFVPGLAGNMPLVRTTTGAPPDLQALRRVVEARVGAAAIRVVPTDSTYLSVLRDPRFRAVLFTTLGLVGLLLAATGLYAVATFDVRQREHEMGVRLSHGATSLDIQRLVIAQACRPVLVGLGVGLAVAFWAVTFLEQFLFQVEPRSGWAYLSVAAVMTATAVLATWLPAWRAGRVDPVVVLRAQ
jgi:predicted permease